MSKPRAVVLGAGVAGLKAAWHLLEQGYEVDVLEKLSRTGGLARSHEMDGFVFDHGPHGFFAREDWLVEEFKDLVGGDEGWHWLTKWSQIHYRGEYFNYPLRIADLARKMSPFKLVQAFLSYLHSRLRLKLTGREPKNAEEYLIDQFGEVLYAEFFGPYTSKVWAVPPTELDANFAKDRVPSLHLFEVLRKLFVDPVKEQEKSRLTPSGRMATHDLHTFYYPKKGAEAVPLGYERKVRENGGRIHFGVTITAIDREAREVHLESEGERSVLAYDGLLSTIPLDVLVPLLQPAAPADIAALAEDLRYRGILLINLSIDKPEVIAPFWIYYTDRFFNRISEYRHFSPDLAPPGKTGICLEVGCNEGDDLWSLPDEEILRLCLPDLENLGLVHPDEVLNHLIIREPRAYPLYAVGYRENINRLVNWVESEARVMTAGRLGRFLYINQDAAIINGLEAARALDTVVRTGEVEERVVWADDRPRRKIVS